MLACDPFKFGRALFHEFSACSIVLPSVGALLDHICASGEQVPLDGYLIHSNRYQINEPTTAFWGIQASIVIQLRLIRKLNLFIAFVHPDHDGCSVSKLVKQLTSSGWVLSRTTCLFPDFGDLVVGKASIIGGVHDSTQARTEPVLFCIPPLPKPLPLTAYMWQPFNKVEYSVSMAKDDESFLAESNCGIMATLPSPLVVASLPNGVRPLYYLHLQGSNTVTLAGAAVLSLDSLCPAFDGSPNPNLFHGPFGLNFIRMVTPMSVPFCHLNSRCALD